jgi:hypothetical protein
MRRLVLNLFVFHYGHRSVLRTCYLHSHSRQHLSQLRILLLHVLHLLLQHSDFLIRINLHILSLPSQSRLTLQLNVAASDSSQHFLHLCNFLSESQVF